MTLLTGPITAHAGSQPYVSGHGINFATGNKVLVETDLALGGSAQGLWSFQRTSSRLSA